MDSQLHAGASCTQYMLNEEIQSVRNLFKDASPYREDALMVDTDEDMLMIEEEEKDMSPTFNVKSRIVTSPATSVVKSVNSPYGLGPSVALCSGSTSDKEISSQVIKKPLPPLPRERHSLKRISANDELVDEIRAQINIWEEEEQSQEKVAYSAQTLEDLTYDMLNKLDKLRVKSRNINGSVDSCMKRLLKLIKLNVELLAGPIREEEYTKLKTENRKLKQEISRIREQRDKPMSHMGHNVPVLAYSSSSSSSSVKESDMLILNRVMQAIKGAVGEGGVLQSTSQQQENAPSAVAKPPYKDSSRRSGHDQRRTTPKLRDKPYSKVSN